MTPIAPSPRDRHRGGLTPGDAPPVVRGTELRYPTTAPERVLLMATIALLPMQQLLPIGLTQSLAQHVLNEGEQALAALRRQRARGSRDAA